jgi:ESCRT-I complex subunit VPS37
MLVLWWDRSQFLRELLITSVCFLFWYGLNQPHNAERSLFKFGIKVHREGQSELIIVRIMLPHDFPDCAPQVEVLTPGVVHNWVDKDGFVVGCSSLYSWNPYSRITDVVGDIMNEFVQTPPRLINDIHTKARISSSGVNARDGFEGLQVKQSEEDEDGVFLPPIPDSFPELDQLSLEELKELRDNDEKFRVFFQNQPMPTMANEMCEQIMKSNEGIARINLDFIDQTEKLQNSVLNLQHEALKHWQEFQALSARHKATMLKFDPLRLLSQMQSSLTQIDYESEILATEYLEGKVELNTFVKRELDLRKLYHLRKAKAEQFRLQLKEKC